MRRARHVHGGGDAREVGLAASGRRAAARPRGRGRAVGRPNGSRSPCTTSTGTVGAASSARRSFSGRPGGCTGNARHSTPTAPPAAAVRHATRAPELRPPNTSGRPGSAGPDVLDDRQPGRVELGGRGRGPPAGHPVGLLDQHHVQAGGERRGGGRAQVRARRSRRPRRGRAAGRRRARSARVHGEPGRPVRGVDLPDDLACPGRRRRTAVEAPDRRSLRVGPGQQVELQRLGDLLGRQRRRAARDRCCARCSPRRDRPQLHLRHELRRRRGEQRGDSLGVRRRRPGRATRPTPTAGSTSGIRSCTWASGPTAAVVSTAGGDQAVRVLARPGRPSASSTPTARPARASCRRGSG